MQGAPQENALIDKINLSLVYLRVDLFNKYDN